MYYSNFQFQFSCPELFWNNLRAYGSILIPICSMSCKSISARRCLFFVEYQFECRGKSTKKVASIYAVSLNFVFDSWKRVHNRDESLFYVLKSSSSSPLPPSASAVLLRTSTRRERVLTSNSQSAKYASVSLSTEQIN